MVTPAETIRILIVDDHAMVREGLSRMLEKEADFRLAGNCATCREALPLLQQDVNVVLLDVDLGGERALEFVDTARRLGFGGQILIVTAGISGPEAVQLIEAGVSGIMHKHRSTQLLCDTIRRIVAGESFIEPDYLTSVFRSIDRTL
jgi:DNA-binding NarL/FixJ family response regulator